MKTSLPLTLALLTAALLPAYPQGAIDFRNGTALLPPPPDRLVYFGDGPFAGQGVIGTQFVAQLFYASDAPSRDAGIAAPDAVLEPPSHFRATTIAGSWMGGTRTLDGTLPGQTKDYVIRAWESSYGDGSYQVAYIGGGMVGQSAPFSYTPPTDPTAPPSAFFMINYAGFSIAAVPEPSTVAVAVLGAATVLFFKRRRRARARLSFGQRNCESAFRHAGRIRTDGFDALAAPPCNIAIDPPKLSHARLP
jgi:hypothetical protein